MRRFTPFLVPVLGVALFFGGVALGDERRDDPEPVLAPADQPVESALGADPELDTDSDTAPEIAGATAALVPLSADPAGAAGAAAAFDPETGIGSGHDAPPFVPRGYDPAATVEDEPGDPSSTTAGDEATTTTTAATDDEGTSSEPPAPAEVDGADEDSVGGIWLLPRALILRFLDPCAAGDADPDSCPEGTGGTVLAPIDGDAPALPALEIGVQVYDSIGIRNLARCPLGANRDGSVSAMLATNIPVTEMRLRVLDIHGEEVGVVTTSTADSERDLFTTRLLEGEPLGPWPGSGVLSCFRLEGLTRGAFYDFEIRAVDDAGNVATGTARLYGAGLVPNTEDGGDLPAASGRPPLMVGYDADRARLVVPVDGDREFVWVGVIERNGEDASNETCSDIENDVLDLHRRGYAGVIQRDPAPLAISPTSPFDRRFDQAERFDLHAPEGAVLDLCVWITTAKQRSFDLPPVVQRNRFEVQAPRHLRTQIHLVRARLDEAVDAGDIDMEAVDWSGVRRTDLPALRRGYTIADTGTVLLDSAGQPHGDTTRLRLTGPSGKFADVLVPTPNACDDGCESWRTLDLKVPGPEYVARLCGGGCGTPPPGTFIGEITVSIRSYAGPNGRPGPSETLGLWDIDAKGAFPRGGARELPAEPQVDWLGSGATAATPTPGARPELRLRLIFDRPVTVEAGMALPADHPCYQAPQTSSAPTTSHTFVWRDACFGQHYAFDVLATEADGDVLDLRSTVDGEPTGRPALFYVDAPGFPIRTWDYDLTFTPTDRLILDKVDLVVDGVRRSLIAGGRSTAGCPSRPLPFSHSTAGIANEGGYPTQWADPLVVRLEVRARTCTGEEVALDLEGRPTLSQAFAGPFTLSGTGEAGAGEVTITARPTVPLVEG